MKKYIIEEVAGFLLFYDLVMRQIKCTRKVVNLPVQWEPWWLALCRVCEQLPPLLLGEEIHYWVVWYKLCKSTFPNDKITKLKLHYRVPTQAINQKKGRHFAAIKQIEDLGSTWSSPENWKNKNSIECASIGTTTYQVKQRKWENEEQNNNISTLIRERNWRLAIEKKGDMFQGDLWDQDSFKNHFFSYFLMRVIVILILSLSPSQRRD